MFMEADGESQTRILLQLWPGQEIKAAVCREMHADTSP